jgi:thioesterase DpgC
VSIEMPELQQWLEARPSLIGIAQADVRLLAQYVETGGSLLRALGPKLSRSCEQLRTAKLIHETCRLLRRQFLDLHAEWVYYILTNGLTVRKGLQELVFEAAELCAGLVPTSAEIALEKNQLQINKEGFEIDQGLFFHALLRSPKIGTHLIESARQPTARALGLIDSFCNEAQLNLGCVAIERRGCAAYLTMNNGYCLNAEDDCLVDDIETAVDLALLDGNVKVGVLRGGIMTHPRYAGRRVFSAGLNLKALRAGQISFVGCMLRREFGYINKIVRGLRLDDELVEGYKKQASKGAVEKPWIAAVDGFAIGGGAQLLLIADRVIAASDSYFSLPAAHEGIIAGFSNQRLARFLGSRKARQVILKGRKIWANEPDAQLLIDEVVNPGDLEAAIEQNIYQLATSAVVANRHMLNVAEEPLATFLQYAAEFAFVQAERLYSEDVLGKT